MHNLNNYQNILLGQDQRFFVLFLIITIWSIVWKGFALWKASKNNQPIWFVVLLILNTIGILEIIYIFAIKHNKNTNEEIEKEIPSPIKENKELAKEENKINTEEKKEEIKEEVKEDIKKDEIKTEEIKQETNQ